MFQVLKEATQKLCLVKIIRNCLIKVKYINEYESEVFGALQRWGSTPDTQSW